MDKTVHYLGIAITITSDGYNVGQDHYKNIGEAKAAIARVRNLKKNKAS